MEKQETKVLDREEISGFLKEYGFKLWSVQRGFSGGKERLQYMETETGVNVTVDPKTQEFKFLWLVPDSIFRLESPKMGPVGNEEHFDRMYAKFRMTVNRLIPGQETDCTA